MVLQNHSQKLNNIGGGSSEPTINFDLDQPTGRIKQTDRTDDLWNALKNTSSLNLEAGGWIIQSRRQPPLCSGKAPALSETSRTAPPSSSALTTPFSRARCQVQRRLKTEQELSGGHFHSPLSCTRAECRATPVSSALSTARALSITVSVGS